MKLPKARTENLLEQNPDKETLIYNLSADKSLNPRSSGFPIIKRAAIAPVNDERRIIDFKAML